MHLTSVSSGSRDGGRRPSASASRWKTARAADRMQGAGRALFKKPMILSATTGCLALIMETLSSRGCSTSANSTSASWPKSKLAEVEIGRSRIGRTRKKSWPKSKVAEVDHPRLPSSPKRLSDGFLSRSEGPILPNWVLLSGLTFRAKSSTSSCLTTHADYTFVTSGMRSSRTWWLPRHSCNYVATHLFKWQPGTSPHQRL